MAGDGAAWPRQQRLRSHVTVADVAKAAGVSAMSVSRVFNGQPGVGAEKARHIRAVAQQMGFRPNRVAANLRRGQQLGLIGLILPESYTPLFTEVRLAIEASLIDLGLIVVTADSGRETARERGMITAFSDRGISGVLLNSEDSSHEYLGEHLGRGFPVVLLGGPPIGVEASAVLTDNEGGMRTAIEHLVAHGHRRIGVISNTSSYPAAARLSGYQRALREFGLDSDPELVCDRPLDPRHGKEATEVLARLADPPTAIVATNYLFTIGVLAADDHWRSTMALVGFDDFEAASLVHPAVTVIAQDATAMGRESARLLLDQISGSWPKTERVVVGTRLIARGSGEIAPSHTSH